MADLITFKKTAVNNNDDDLQVSILNYVFYGTENPPIVAILLRHFIFAKRINLMAICAA